MYTVCSPALFSDSQLYDPGFQPRRMWKETWQKHKKGTWTGIEPDVRSNSVRDVYGLRDTSGQPASTNQPPHSPECAGHVGSGSLSCWDDSRAKGSSMEQQKAKEEAIIAGN